MAIRTKNMTDGKPSTLILTFALPLMIGNVFQQLFCCNQESRTKNETCGNMIIFISFRILSEIPRSKSKNHGNHNRRKQIGHAHFLTPDKI